MAEYETFSTTADVGIRIRGKGYAGLFQNAVNGLNLLYFGSLPNWQETSTKPAAHPFQFHGDSCENILVNLLSEIVFLLQNENRVTVALNIRQVDETYIKADVLTVPNEWEPELEIKSVTYHNLKVKEEKGIKSTEVIFDI